MVTSLQLLSLAVAVELQSLFAVVALTAAWWSMGSLVNCTSSEQRLVNTREFT